MATAPDVVWIRPIFGISASSSRFTSITCLTLGPFDEIYAVGTTDRKTLDGGTVWTGGNGVVRGLIFGLANDGVTSWTKITDTSTYGESNASSTTIGTDGAIYVVGSGIGNINGQTSNGNSDGFVTKYNTDGSQAWTTLIGGQGDDEITAIASDASGAIYLVGNSRSPILDGQPRDNYLAGFLARYNSDGSKAWTHFIGASNTGVIDHASSLAMGIDGSIYVAGWVESSPGGIYNGKPIGGWSDGYLTRFNSDGTTAWTQLIGGNDNEKTYSVATGIDGSIYVAGYTGSATLDGQVSNGQMDGFLTCYLSNGSKAWTRLLGGTNEDRLTSVTTGGDGSIYVAGYTYSNFDGQINARAEYAGSAAFVTRYNSDGSKSWTRFVGGAGKDIAYALSVKVDAHGAVYLAGQAFANTNGGNYVQAPDGLRFSANADGFIVKLAFPNYLPSGSVSIIGTAAQNQTLTAINSLADLDGMGIISYQWEADGVNIEGASSATLTLTQPQVGKAITVSTNYSDGRGTAESMASLPTTLVANVNDAPTGTVTVSGTAKFGQTVTASNTLADADGLGTIGYQWLADGVAISGATGASLTVGQAQLGKAIAVTASYTDGFGTLEAVSSASISVEQVLVNVAVSQAQVMEGGDLVYTFTRTGDTSSALTVNLGVSGTATAADYTSTLALSGSGLPTEQWTRMVGGAGDDYGHSVATGVDGAVCIAGTNFTSDGGRDGFVTKYTTDGNKAWTRQAGGAGVEEGYSVAIGADGSVYIAGYTSSDPLNGQASNGGVDGFVTKYTADGTQAWTRLAGGAGNDDGRSVATGADGSVYIAGHTNSGSIDGQANNGGVDGFVTKYTADGTKAWTRLAGGTGDDIGHSVATGADGSVYIAGYTSNGSIDGQASNGGTDGFVTKYTADGTKAWTRLAGSTGEDSGLSVAIGADGSVYIAGYTNSGSIDGQASNGGVDGFVTKYTADGTKAWTRLAGGAGFDYGYSVATGADGSVYFGGYTTSGSIDGQAINGGGDGFVTKFTADGTKAWTRLAGGASYDLGWSVATGADGSVYIAGHTYSDSIDGQASNGGADGFVTKFSDPAQPRFTFARGSSTATLTVHATADQVAEAPETLTVSVVAGDGYTLGSNAVATGTIVDVPANHTPTGAVTITGTAKPGQTLTATNTLADADGMGTISYQWFTEGQAIAGATQSSFTITQAQLGKALSVVASYTDGGGTLESVTSNAPVQVVSYNTSATENSTAVTLFAATDPLLGTAPKYTLSGLDASLFKISAKGALTFAVAKDFEQPVDFNHDGIYEVSVTLTNAKTGYKVVKDLTVGVEFAPILGTAGADNLKGTAGYDTLDGQGGDDKLTGGAGLDTFLVTSGHDTITDFNLLTKGASGTEILQVSAGATVDATLKAAWTATADSHNEGTANILTAGMAVDLSAVTQGQGWNVTNTGKDAIIKGSQFNDVLTGGTGNDQLMGGAGDDLLIGGKGSDILTGGTGSDTFRLSGDTKTDHVTDFLSGTDRIELDNALFKALLTEGQLAANQFGQGTAATTATQRIVYDQPTGNLWYDADGSGKTAAVLIAVLDNHVQIANTDFWVI